MAKKRGRGKILGKAISAISGFTPAGRIAKTAFGAAKGLGRAVGIGRGTGVPSRRSRGITQKYLNRAMSRLVRARIEGKIMKEKFKVINIIK